MLNHFIWIPQYYAVFGFLTNFIFDCIVIKRNSKNVCSTSDRNSNYKWFRTRSSKGNDNKTLINILNLNIVWRFDESFNFDNQWEYILANWTKCTINCGRPPPCLALSCWSLQQNGENWKPEKGGWCTSWIMVNTR